jgi:DNA-directed RNA polymerase alpha subunit
MSISNISHQGNVVSFIIKGVDISVINSIRRVVLSDIKTWAIDEFTIIKNKSPFTDEFITDRLGFIPIKSQLIGDKLPTFTLNVLGEVNAIKNIYSKDIVSSDGKKYFQDDILILKLKGITSDRLEHVHIEMALREGTSKDNAKWSPVSVSGYHPDKKDAYSFFLEAKEQQPSLVSLIEGFNILIAKLENIKKGIHSHNKEKFNIITISENYHEITLFKENHTIGNLINSHIFNTKSTIVSFIGYRMVHPLEETIKIKIITNNPEKVLLDTIDELMQILNKLLGYF